MKKTIIFALLFSAILSTYTATAQSLLPAWGDQGDGTFRNPVLFADYNNPDVIRVGDDFYMVAASHHFMGNPILHSKDMVNWEIVSRLWRRLDIAEKYNEPGQAYQQGSWAPALVSHNNKFMVYFASPIDGLFRTVADHPAGPWSPLEHIVDQVRWEDPYPFWDDDGQAYLLRSEVGAGPVIIHKMNSEGNQILDGGAVIAYGPTLEGPKMLKRDGYYYILAPEGGIAQGYQVVFRSKNVYGPYEKKVILEQGTTDINGPHQGAWITLENGEDWFYHFQEIAGYGRVLWLEPAGWKDGWPMMGEDYDGNGIGEPVKFAKKPTVTGQHPVRLPVASDEFDSENLGLQWLWNHNPVPDAWSLSKVPGHLTLRAMPLVRKSGTNHNMRPVPFEENSVVFAKNTLVQLIMGKESEAATEMKIDQMVDGQFAGLSLFNRHYLSVGVTNQGDGKRILFKTNTDSIAGPAVKGDRVWLKARVTSEQGIATGWMFYSLDGRQYIPIGKPAPIDREWFEGAKYALFSYTQKEKAGGTASFNWFRYAHDGPVEGER
jgi:beta-xylosidase